MKVVHLAKYYPPEWGGMERVTRDLVEGMAERGVNSHVIAFTNEEELVGTFYSSSIVVTRCAILVNPANQPISIPWLWHSLRAGLGCDSLIVHVPNFLALPALVFLALARIARRGPAQRIVLWHSDVVNKGLTGLLMRPMEIAIAALATRIVTTSAPYASASPVLKLFPGRLEVIPLGIEPPRQLDEPANLSPDLLTWINERKVVLAVGRLVPYKGFDVLIDAAHAFTKRTASCCIIVGTGPEAGKLQKQIESLSLSDSVRIVGPLSAEELEALFQKSAVYCMSSRERSEAFGVVLLEAMSHGMPIVATRIPGSGVPWVADTDTSLQVEVEDDDAMSLAVERLLFDDALARRLSMASLTRFNCYFSRSRMVESFVQLLTYKLRDR